MASPSRRIPGLRSSDQDKTFPTTFFSFTTILPDYYRIATADDLAEAQRNRVTDLDAPVSSAVQQATLSAFGQISAFTNLRFAAAGSRLPDIVIDRADVRASNVSEPFPDPNNPPLSAATAFYPLQGGSTKHIGGDVLIGSVANAQTGYLARHSLLHEVGHAVGQKHPFAEPNDPYLDSAAKNTANVASTGLELTYLYTVEAYGALATQNAAPPAVDSDVLLGYKILPISYMVKDIANLRDLYGVKPVDTGNTVHRAQALIPEIGQDGVYAARTIVDDGGTSDTLTAHGWARAVLVDLNEGQFSAITRDPASVVDPKAPTGKPHYNLSNAFGTVIENATGTVMGDVLIGTTGRNTLRGEDARSSAGGGDFLFGDYQTALTARDENGALVFRWLPPLRRPERPCRPGRAQHRQ